MRPGTSDKIAFFIFISSTIWQSSLGLSCYSCTTLVDNGVTKPGNQTCEQFQALSSSAEKRKFIEECPSGVKACSHSEKRGLVGASSGSSYDIIQKGCYGRSWVNSAKINTCEDLGGAGGKTERICLCDANLCELDPGEKVEDVGRKSGGESSRIKNALIFMVIPIILRNY